MNLVFHKDAKFEFKESTTYYRGISASLGLDFITEVQHTLNRIKTYPDAWTILGDNIRRALVNRFPYGILYKANSKQVYIIAVMNLHRKPNYWADRLD